MATSSSTPKERFIDIPSALTRYMKKTYPEIKADFREVEAGVTQYMKKNYPDIDELREGSRWYNDVFRDPKREPESRFEETVQNMKRDVDLYFHKLLEYRDRMYPPEETSSMRAGSEARPGGSSSGNNP